MLCSDFLASTAP